MGKRGNARGYPPSDSESRSDALAGVRRASACKRDDANQMARTIMSKDCNRGQSAMWRRVGNRSSIWRSIHAFVTYTVGKKTSKPSAPFKFSLKRSFGMR